MTLLTLAAYRKWQKHIAAGTATPELAIKLRRRILAMEGEHEAAVFTSLALTHAQQERARQD